MESNTKKVVLLVGGSSRIGREIGRRLLQDGHVVYFGYRNSNSEFPKHARPLHIDVTQDVQCKSAVDKVISEQKRLDVLINCVGVSVSGPAVNHSSGDFQKLLDVNVVGPFRMITFARPYLKEAKGLIINVSSLNAFLAYPNFALYSATKHALEALGSALQFEIAPDVRLVNVAPGAVGDRNAKPIAHLAHKPLRERFAFINWLMPMTYPDVVSSTISSVVAHPDQASGQILIGHDAKIVYLLKKFLPRNWFDGVISRLWKGQK